MANNHADPEPTFDWNNTDGAARQRHVKLHSEWAERQVTALSAENAALKAALGAISTDLRIQPWVRLIAEAALEAKTSIYSNDLVFVQLREWLIDRRHRDEYRIVLDHLNELEQKYANDTGPGPASEEPNGK